MTLGAQRTVATSSFFFWSRRILFLKLSLAIHVSPNPSTARGTSWLAVHVSRLHYELPSLPDKKDVVESVRLERKEPVRNNAG
jgi:hypothetical protein